MVDEVAVEIDIVLGDAPQPGEAIGIDRVYSDQSRIRRKLAPKPGLEAAGLCTRAAEALGAMRCGNRDQDPARLARAKACHIGRELLATWALRLRIDMDRERRTGSRCGVAELAPGFGVVAREIVAHRHGDLLEVRPARRSCPSPSCPRLCRKRWRACCPRRAGSCRNRISDGRCGRRT